MARPRLQFSFFVKWIILIISSSLGAVDFSGTDLLQGPIAEGLARAKASLVVDFGGTFSARQSFIEGRVGAVVLLNRPNEVTPTPKGIEVREFRLASAVVVVAAHSLNKVESMTFQQLANSFSQDMRFPLYNWNDLDASLRSELMLPGVFSPSGTLVSEIFQGLVMAGKPFRIDVRQRMSSQQVEAFLSSRTGSILLLPQHQTGIGRIIQVADGRPERSKTAYTPDENNVYNGDYPLQLPLYLYVRSDRMRTLKPAIVWLCSDEAADLIRKQGLYPAPKLARDRFVQRLDTP